jgi:hypothetical protein
MGIEPTSEAWEAYLKARKRTNWRHFCAFSIPQMDSNWSSGSGGVLAGSNPALSSTHLGSGLGNYRRLRASASSENTIESMPMTEPRRSEWNPAFSRTRIEATFLG